jgi:hypothetical protein
MERHPVHGGPRWCANGHELSYPNVTVSWMQCHCSAAESHGGHMTWTCRTCDDVRGHGPGVK